MKTKSSIIYLLLSIFIAYACNEEDHLRTNKTKKNEKSKIPDKYLYNVRAIAKKTTYLVFNVNHF